MKGIQGLVIAAALGITGGVCNWLYISQQADQYERVSLLAIKRDVQLEIGDRFKESHFMKVDVPKLRLGNLESTAVLWKDRAGVVNLPATRNYTGGAEILMVQDLQTPAKEDLNKKIGPDERIMWLPVDSRTFNPQHVNPGDQVSFRIPALLAQPVPASAPDGGGDEIIGPFRILALGNRKGRREIHRAAGLKSGSENVIAISVEIRANQLAPKAQRISAILQRTNFKGVQVLLHPASEKEP